MTETTHTRRLAFQISGDFITETARNFLRDGLWRTGYDFLLETLHGLEPSHALDILQGRSKLTGVNEIQLEPDSAESQLEIKATLDHLARNCFKFQHRTYRPYGRVSFFQREDWHFALNCDSGTDTSMARNLQWLKAFQQLSLKSHGHNPWDAFEVKLALRSFFYAKSPSSDIMLVSKMPDTSLVCVLCEEVALDLPLWYPAPEDPHPIIEHMARLRALPELSALHAITPSQTTPLDTPLTPEPARAPHSSFPLSALDLPLGDYAQSTAELLLPLISDYASNDTEYGWLHLTQYDPLVSKNISLSVPRRAFICAALSRAHATHLMPPYSAFSPVGLKLPNDDPFHSDAWIGASLPLSDAYNEDCPHQRLFMAELYSLQRSLLQFPFDILARGHSRCTHLCAKVTHNPDEANPETILVLPRADPQYTTAALKSLAVIVETGSKLAHLSTVSREQGVPVLRIPNALTAFPPECTLDIDLHNGSLHITN